MIVWGTFQRLLNLNDILSHYSEVVKVEKTYIWQAQVNFLLKCELIFCLLKTLSLGMHQPRPNKVIKGRETFKTAAHPTFKVVTKLLPSLSIKVKQAQDKKQKVSVEIRLKKNVAM